MASQRNRKVSDSNRQQRSKVDKTATTDRPAAAELTLGHVLEGQLMFRQAPAAGSARYLHRNALYICGTEQLQTRRYG